MTSPNATATVPAAAVTVIEPVHRWVPLNLHEVWEFRDLLFFLIQREIKSRYRQMALGPLWIVLQPLLNMVIFTILFGKMAQFPSDGIPYPLFSYSALLPWTFFVTATTLSSNSLLNYKNIIAKVYFPRLIVPLAGLVVAFVDLMVSMIVLFGMMLFYGFHPGWEMLTLVLPITVAAAAALAIGLWTACWVVHFRDVATILSFLLRALMYASPVVYALSLVPEKWLTLYRLNPLTNVIEAFRWALLGKGVAPDVLFVISALVIIPFLITGAYYFRRTERNIVDVV